MIHADDTGVPATYEQPTSVVIRSVADQLVLLNIETEFYYSLDAVGAAMYGGLVSGQPPRLVVDEICQRFDNPDADAVLNDLESLIERLRHKKLLEVCHG